MLVSLPGSHIRGVIDLIHAPGQPVGNKIARNCDGRDAEVFKLQGLKSRGSKLNFHVFLYLFHKQLV
jgi:hypothetical protein